MLHWRLAQRVAHTFHHMCEPKAHATPKAFEMAHHLPSREYYASQSFVPSVLATAALGGHSVLVHWKFPEKTGR
jgi:hypothetical protein